MKSDVKKEQKKIKKKKYRLKIKVVLFSIFFFILILWIAYYLLNQKITNIYVTGNEYLTDWEIIKLAKLHDYPLSLGVTSKTIAKRIGENLMISDVKVRKKQFTEVYIEVVENRPLLYYQEINKTILLDKEKTSLIYDVPILSTTLEEELYDELISKMKKVSKDVLNKMSEIKYFPDEVDDERFLITMTDGNYVYLTLNKFTLINDYNNIVKEFNNKKGILFLNSGGYFKIMEN